MSLWENVRNRFGCDLLVHFEKFDFARLLICLSGLVSKWANDLVLMENFEIYFPKHEKVRALL